MKPRIYLFVGPDLFDPLPACVGYALAEDGTELARSLFATVDLAKIRMGATGDRQPKVYRTYYPDGYELEWIEQEALPTHAGYQTAYAINKAQWEAGRPEREAARAAQMEAVKAKRRMRPVEEAVGVDPELEILREATQTVLPEPDIEE